MTPCSTTVLGVFSLDQIADVGVIMSMHFKLFGREIIFKVFQSMCMITVPKCHEQTDGQTDEVHVLWHNRALLSVACGQNRRV